MKLEKFEQYNIPGLKKVEYVFPDEVASIVSSSTNNIATITLQPGCAWHEIYFTPSNEDVRISEKEDDSGTWYDANIKLNNPRIDDSKSALIEQFREKFIIVVITDMNDFKLLIGNLEQPARIKSNTALNGNNNRREISIFAQLDSQPQFVNSYYNVSAGDFNNDFNDDFLI